jgi:soluble lytic murein transglycosylase-like protein
MAKKAILRLLLLAALCCCSMGYSNDIGYIKKRIEHYATNAEIDPALFKAIIMKESYFRTKVSLYEPSLTNNKKYVAKIPSEYLTNDLAFSSIGICQMLYGTAIDLGYRGSPEGLYDLETSLKYGAMYIKEMQDRYRFRRLVISAYNAGLIYLREDGKVENYKYVDKVIKYWEYYSAN